jgi:outer membrane receptor for ferrienterochelin and colicins
MRRIALAAVVLLFGAGAAWAQSIDYGAFESLFGEPVTTSATGTPQRRSDVPVNMEIITADDIRRSGATNIPDALAHVVGVDVLRWGISSADVSIRGYDAPFSPRLLVLVNGREVYLDDWGRTQWDAIPVQLAEIRQIEIIKGPNTALFGFNAAAGVINIITYNPLYDTVNAASVTDGTQGFVQGSAVTTARLGDAGGLRLSAGGYRADEFSNLGSIAQQRGLARTTWQGTASADLQVHIDSNQEFELEVTHADLRHLEVVTGWVPIASTYDTSSIKARYSASTSIGLLQLTAYTNFVNEEGRFGGGILNLQTLKFDSEKTLVQVQDLFKLGPVHTFRISAEYQHDTVNTSPVAGGTVGYDIGSLSGMWNWQILPELSLTAAPRVDVLWLDRSGVLTPGLPLTNADWSRQIVEPSFNVGLVYDATDRDVLLLTIARGAQLPSLIGFGALQFSFLSLGLVYSGSPFIKPTAITNYEVDWDHRFPALNTTTRAAVFYQTSDSLQTITSGTLLPLSPRLFFNFSDNVGDSDEIGLELSAKGTLPGGWRWSISYSPRLVRDYFLPLQTPDQTGVDFEHTTPRHVVDLGGGWSSGKWEIDAAARFESSFEGLTGTRAALFTTTEINNYLSLDARVAYRIRPNLTFSVIGHGITASKQVETSIGSVDRRVLAQLQAKF